MTNNNNNNNNNNNDNGLNKEEISVEKKVTIVCTPAAAKKYKNVLAITANDPATEKLVVPKQKLVGVYGFGALNSAYYEYVKTLPESSFNVLNGRIVRISSACAGGLKKHLTDLGWDVKCIENLRHVFYNGIADSYSITGNPSWLKHAERLGEGYDYKHKRIAAHSFMEVIIGTREETGRTTDISDTTCEWIQVNAGVYVKNVRVATIYSMVKAADKNRARTIVTSWAKDRYGSTAMIGPFDKVPFMNDLKAEKNPDVLARAQKFFAQAYADRTLDGVEFYTPAYKAAVARRKSADITSPVNETKVEQPKVDITALRTENEQLKASIIVLKAENEQLKADKAALEAKIVALTAATVVKPDDKDPDDNPTPTIPVKQDDVFESLDDDFETISSEESAALLGITVPSSVTTAVPSSTTTEVIAPVTPNESVTTPSVPEDVTAVNDKKTVHEIALVNKEDAVTASSEQKTVITPVDVEQKVLDSLFGKKDLDTSYDPFDPAADIARKKAAWAKTVEHTKTAVAILGVETSVLMRQVRMNFSGYLYDIRVKDGKVFINGTGKAVLKGQKGWHQVVINDGKLERTAFLETATGNKLFL